MKAYELNADGYEFVTQLQSKILKYFDDRETELRTDDNKHLNERMENLHAWRCVREILFSDMEVNDNDGQ